MSACGRAAWHDEVHDFVSGEAAEAPVAYAMKYLGSPLFRSVIVLER